MIDFGFLALFLGVNTLPCYSINLIELECIFLQWNYITLESIDQWQLPDSLNKLISGHNLASHKGFLTGNWHTLISGRQYCFINKNKVNDIFSWSKLCRYCTKWGRCKKINIKIEES